MKIEAILHTPLSKDAFMTDERTIVVRLRTGKNDMRLCQIYYGDRVCINEPIDVISAAMEKVASDVYFDYYEASIQSDYTRVCYYFEVQDMDGERKYISEYGVTSQMNCHRTQYFQFPYLHRQNMIQPPEWTKHMVMYHIFPDSFASEKRQISKQGKRYELNNGLMSECRNGGTIKGIVENLDYLSELHINCIYLNPIFVAASYHKYDTIDYFDIDPCMGTKEEFKEFVKQCHKRGIKVILDGVFNHCGSGFFAFQDVIKNGEKSAYKDWFYRLQFPIKMEVPLNYEAFAYVPEMPKLNTANPEVEKYFCEVGKYWIREMDIDGWRLDVANEINHDFWRAFRKAVKEEKQDVFLIGEIWEDSTVWLQGDQFDSTMNYTFSYICREFFAQKAIRVSEFAQKIHKMNLRYPEQVTNMQMNFLDTHDVPRFLSYCNGDIERFKLAVFFMMTAQGIPSVFYGDEKGIMGTIEAEYRNPMPWQDEQHQKLEEFYSKVIQIRLSHIALQNGKYRTVLIDDEKEIYGFMRASDTEKVFVYINIGAVDQVIAINDNVKILCPAMQGRIVDANNLTEIY